MKTASWLGVLSLVAFAPLAAIAEEASKDISDLAKGLVAEHPVMARKAEDALVALGWPIVRELELLKRAKFLPPQDLAAFEPRAEQVQRRVEQETWARLRPLGQMALDGESKQVKKGEEGWTITSRNFSNPLLRRWLHDHVIFTTELWFKGGMVLPIPMEKVAVHVSTGKALRFDDDPTPLFNAEGVKPETPEQATEVADLFDLLALDGEFDLLQGVAQGLKAGGCVLVRGTADVPGADKSPVPPEAAARIVPPSTRAVDGGFEVDRCVWYKLGGCLFRRTLTFRAGSLEAKTERLAINVGSYYKKQ